MKTKIITFNDINDDHRNCTLTFGHFNTIHAGHIRYLKHAKDTGNKLIIALLGDEIINGKRKYIFEEKERAEALSLISIADYILLIRDNKLKDIVESLKPKIFVLGKEFEVSSDENITEAIKLQKERGFTVEFRAGEINYVSADVLMSSQSDLSKARKNLFLETCQKESINSDKLLYSMSQWSDVKLLVIGDTIVDEYAACEPLGLSAEAPVVVVKEMQKKVFVGGAAIVASHIKALGTKCVFLSVTGEDSLSTIVENKLQDQGIDVHIIKDSSRPTTFKKRYIVENQKLFRVSRLEDHKLNKNIEDLVINRLRKEAPYIHGIVVSDFVYGVITERILNEINALSEKYSLMIFGDLQCSSQVGDITNFKNFSLLCPNEKETRIALKDKETGLEKLSRRLIETTKTKRLIMKLGADGFIAYDFSSGIIRNQSFPALSVNPLDVTGAGDSLLAVMSVGLSKKQSMISTSAIACCMASIAVETMGNTPISKEKLITRINDVFK